MKRFDLLEYTGAVVPLDRADSREIAATIVMVTGSQDAAAEALGATQSQLSGWTTGKRDMTPSFMMLARRMLVEAATRRWFIPEFYIERLMNPKWWPEWDGKTWERYITRTESWVDSRGRRVVNDRRTLAPATIGAVEDLVEATIREFFTWSWHAAGDWFGFYRPAEIDGRVGMSTVVFGVDLPDNDMRRNLVEPVFRFESPRTETEGE